MRCVLHIGTEKTATKLLQSWVYSNRDALGQKGVYLPDGLGKPNNINLAVGFSSVLDIWLRRRNIETLEESRQYAEPVLRDFVEEIGRVSDTYDTCLISSEQLSTKVLNIDDINRLSDFLKSVFDQVSIICYFRPQFDKAVSLYSTGLRQNENRSLSEVLENVVPANPRYDSLGLADNWSGVFGAGNCTFRLYDRDAFFAGDIRQDFLRSISPSLDCDGLDMSLGSKNESLTGLQAAAYLAINRSYQLGDQYKLHHEAWCKGTKQRLSQVGSLKAGRIRIENGDTVSERFAELNREFLSKYFGPSNSLNSRVKLDPEEMTFTQRDVEGIVGDIVEALVPAAPAAGVVDDAAADMLRDIAIAIENGRSLSLRDAWSLMALANRIRPTGDKIKEKLAAYDAILNA